MAEQRKTNKYSAMAKAQNAKFIPFAVEMYGEMYGEICQEAT